MRKVARLGFGFLLAMPAFPQAVSPILPAPVSGTDRIHVPPPASVEPLRMEVGAQAMSNYVRGGVLFQGSYVDNLYAGGSRSPLAEKIYLISPIVELDRTRSTRHIGIRYSTGFQYYQPTSALNQSYQNANLDYQVRMTPHSTITLNDNFRYTSTPFNVAALGAGGSVSGSTQPVTPGVVLPYAKRLSNGASGEFTLQTGRRTLIGASGSATLLHYPDLTSEAGIYDSDSRGGSGFYTGRLTDKQYLGALYQYALTQVHPTGAESETQVHSVLGFYTFYPKERLSLSVSGGPQYYHVSQAPLVRVDSSDPALTASLGWQGNRTSFAAGYSQGITGGGGLAGAYHSKSATAAAVWMMSRNWMAGLDASYAINKNATPLLVGAFRGGHSIFGTCSVQHAVGRQITFAVQYDRLHQSYSGIQAISANPDSNRVAASISWQIMRPLGQ